MTRALAIAAAALAVFGSGCMAGMAATHAASAPQPQAAAAPEPVPAAVMQACPVAVPGTQLAAADTPDGEAVTFTTTPDGVAELRSRVHAMADMHNRHHAQPGGANPMGGMDHGAMMGGGMMGGGGMGSSGGRMAMMPPPSRAAVEDVDGGARLVVTPNDPADLERLRSAIRMHARHMQETGTCGMGGARAPQPSGGMPH